jgi:hypothetical protein
MTTRRQSPTAHPARRGLNGTDMRTCIANEKNQNTALKNNMQHNTKTDSNGMNQTRQELTTVLPINYFTFSLKQSAATFDAPVLCRNVTTNSGRAGDQRISLAHYGAPIGVDRISKVRVSGARVTMFVGVCLRSSFHLPEPAPLHH